MPNSVLGFPCGSAGKETAWSARDLGLILGLGRFPGKGYPLQDSGLENSVDYSAWGCKELGTSKWLSLHFRIVFQGFPGGSVGKEFTFNALDAKVQFSSVQSQEMWVQFLGQEDPLEKGMATHSSILTRRIPRTEKPDWLRSRGSQRVEHNWSDWTCMHAVVF